MYAWALSAPTAMLGSPTPPVKKRTGASHVMGKDPSLTTSPRSCHVIPLSVERASPTCATDR
jgi:hypothetical protein